MSTDVQKLEAFLMETFQLLMSTVMVLDAQAGIEHAKRSERLIQLATVYVPLSFVTGIFGMNIKEIKVSALPLWVSMLTLVVVAVIMAITLAIMNWIPKWRMSARIRRKTTECKNDRRHLSPFHAINSTLGFVFYTMPVDYQMQICSEGADFETQECWSGNELTMKYDERLGSSTWLLGRASLLLRTPQVQGIMTTSGEIRDILIRITLLSTMIKPKVRQLTVG